MPREEHCGRLRRFVSPPGPARSRPGWRSRSIMQRVDFSPGALVRTSPAAPPPRGACPGGRASQPRRRSVCNKLSADARRRAPVAELPPADQGDHYSGGQTAGCRPSPTPRTRACRHSPPARQYRLGHEPRPAAGRRRRPARPPSPRARQQLHTCPSSQSHHRAPARPHGLRAPRSRAALERFRQDSACSRDGACSICGRLYCIHYAKY